MTYKQGFRYGMQSKIDLEVSQPDALGRPQHFMLVAFQKVAQYTIVTRDVSCRKFWNTDRLILCLFRHRI